MKRVCLGRIADAHGVKGLVKIAPYGEDITLLNGALFTNEQGEDTLNITLKNSLGKFILAEIEGSNDRDEALSLKGTKLWLSRDALPEPEEGQFYIDDLIGLEAVDENGKTIGKVIAVENYGAGDLLEIKPPSGSGFLLPFNDDTVIEVADTITLQNFEAFKELS